MAKLTILIADDQRVHRNQVIEWFINQPLISYFEPYIECKYIKENIDGEKNFDNLIFEMKQLDIALIDMQWLEDGFNGWEGGFYMIKKIEDIFSNCLILPVTQFRFSQEVHPEVTASNGKRYDALPKDGDDIDKSTRFFSYLEQWQLTRIKNLHNSQEEKFKNALLNQNENETLRINGNIVQIKDFLFPITKFAGNTYFERTKILQEIFGLSEVENRPTNRIWDDKRVIETYIKIMNNPAKVERIISETEVWFDEIIKISTNKSYLTPCLEKWRAINDPFGPRNIKNIDNIILNKIIWRRLLIKIERSDKISQDLKTTKWISGIEKNGQLMEGTLSDEKKLFSHLGIEMRNSSIKIQKLFKEEEDFIKTL